MGPRAPGAAYGVSTSTRRAWAGMAAWAAVARWLARTISRPAGGVSETTKPPFAPPGTGWTAASLAATCFRPRYTRTSTVCPATYGATVPRTRTRSPRRATSSWPTWWTRSSLIDIAPPAGGGDCAAAGAGGGGAGGGLRRMRAARRTRRGILANPEDERLRDEHDAEAVRILEGQPVLRPVRVGGRDGVGADARRDPLHAPLVTEVEHEQRLGVRRRRGMPAARGQL